jgi:hypothetical protein
MRILVFFLQFALVYRWFLLLCILLERLLLVLLCWLSVGRYCRILNITWLPNVKRSLDKKRRILERGGKARHAVEEMVHHETRAWDQQSIVRAGGQAWKRHPYKLIRLFLLAMTGAGFFSSPLPRA